MHNLASTISPPALSEAMHNFVRHGNKAVHKKNEKLMPSPPPSVLGPYQTESLIGSVGLLFMTTTHRETR